jgi:hypothetical protein
LQERVHAGDQRLRPVQNKQIWLKKYKET